MAGMFPTSFLGGVEASLDVPGSYVAQFTTQPYILFYAANSRVAVSPALLNSLLAEFAFLFDQAGWVYQPGSPSNLWGALNTAFSSGGGSANASVTSVNGKTGPNVVLTVDDIAGAAPTDDASLTGHPQAPTGPLGARSRQIATQAFVLRELDQLSLYDAFGNPI